MVVRALSYKDKAHPAKMLMRAATLSRTWPVGPRDIATWSAQMDAGFDGLGYNISSLVCGSDFSIDWSKSGH